MESITNVYPLPYCILSNGLEELGYKWHLEDTAGVLFAPWDDYRERRQMESIP
jgi:hypothetical protein